MIKYNKDRLKSFTKDISDTEQMKAEHSIKMVEDAVKNYDWKKFELECPKICLKGSYNNGTNVKIDSDVDIYALFNAHVLIDTEKQCISKYHQVDSKNSKTCEYYRQHLENALYKGFGSKQFTNGKKVFKIRETSYKHEAEVMTAFIAKDDKNNDECNGVYLFFKDNTRAITYPEQDKLNSDLKDRDTYGYYKNMVRVFKGIKNDLNLEIPSFLIECMIYNIPNNLIMIGNDDYLEKAKKIIEEWIKSPTNFEYVETNGIKKLFAEHQKWELKDASDFISKMQEVLF